MSWLRKPARPGIAEYTPRTVPPPPPPEPAQPAGPPAWCHIQVPHPPHLHTTHGRCPGVLGEPLPHPAVLALRRHIQRSDACGQCANYDDPATCHIETPHPPHHHVCILDAGHPGRHRDETGQTWTGLADALNDERAGPTAEQTIRWWALTAACTLVPGLWVDLDQQAAAILDVAGRFETWIRDGTACQHTPDTQSSATLTSNSQPM